MLLQNIVNRVPIEKAYEAHIGGSSTLRPPPPPRPVIIAC